MRFWTTTTLAALLAFGGCTNADDQYSLTTEAECIDLVCPDDDFFEDNDAAGSGTPMTGDAEFNAVACDADRYGADLASGCWLRASVQYATDQGDLSVQLAQNGVPVEAWHAQDTGDDIYETFDNVSARLNAEHTALTGVVCNGSFYQPVDEYEVYLENGCTVIAELTYNQGDGDLSLTVPGDTSDGSTGSESAEYTATSDGDVLVVVESPQDDELVYDLDVTVDCL